jgi:hypothetical protein
MINHIKKLRIYILRFFFLSVTCFGFATIAYGQNDLPMQNYGPSRGRIPRDYSRQINNNIGSNLNHAKFFAEKAIEYFLDDDCPLPKNIVGDFKDDQGKDAASMYRANEGCDALMLSFYNLYKTYPDDSFCSTLLDRVIAFADCMLEFGTDRYGVKHTPLLATILMRGETPYVPYDPANANNAVSIELRRVWSYSHNNFTTNYMAIGIGNIWYGSDESHKACWRGTDLEASNDLYTLLYALSQDLNEQQFPDKDKYKRAADASLAYWMNQTQTESNLYPWGEHAGWNFYSERYSDDYYHAPLHEYKGGFLDNLDKLIENQRRVRPDEMTPYELYTVSIRATHTAVAERGSRFNGHDLEGMFLFCRHGPLWADRLTARNQPNNHDIEEFGTFPRHIGSYLYLMSHAYNRSNKQFVRDSLETNLIFFIEGVEQQRTIYTNNQYYPFAFPVSWRGYPSGLINLQNDGLGIFAKRSSSLMDGLNNSIRDKLINIGNNTNIFTNYSSKPWSGPTQVSISFPVDNYTIYNTSSTSLQWRSSIGASTYRLYLSTDKGLVSEATPDSIAFIGETSSLNMLIEGLIPDTTYYWAVDAVNPNGDITKGDIMIFKTSSGTKIPITDIHLEESTLELRVGESYKISYSVIPANASNPFVVWSVSDETIADISDEGVVKAKIKGNTIVVVTDIDGIIHKTLSLIVNPLSQEISFYLPGIIDCSETSMFKLEASSTSDLPIKYEIIDGNAKLLGSTTILAERSGFINGTIIASQNLNRLKVNGMNTLFYFDLANSDIPADVNHATFRYATIVDGHRRNYDIYVDMIEYGNNWSANSSVPPLLSSSPISNTIIQPKIPLVSTFPSQTEYVDTYQKMLQLNISSYVKRKIVDNELNFTIALQARKTHSSDGEDFIRIASNTYTDDNLRPRIELYSSDVSGNMLKFKSNGEVTIKATQQGNDIFEAAEAVVRKTLIHGIVSNINTVDFDKTIVAYPNPVTNELRISFGGYLVTRVIVYDTLSRLVLDKSPDGNQETVLPMSHLPSGLYKIVVETNVGFLTLKTIKK